MNAVIDHFLRIWDIFFNTDGDVGYDYVPNEILYKIADELIQMMGSHNELKKVKAVEDGDGHWHVLPNDMIDSFYKYHNPVDDAIGNAEALYWLYEQGYKLF